MANSDLVNLIAQDTTMTVANNIKVSVEGICKIKFLTGDNYAQIPIRITNCLSYDLVLGIDFLMAFGFVINFHTDTYSFGGGGEKKVFRTTKFGFNTDDCRTIS